MSQMRRSSVVRLYTLMKIVSMCPERSGRPHSELCKGRRELGEHVQSEACPYMGSFRIFWNLTGL